MPEPCDLSAIRSQNPYSWAAAEKTKHLIECFSALTAYHARQCREYARILNAHGAKAGPYTREEDIPFLPVRLFKEFRLSSIPAGEESQTVTSSGTTGQAASQIVLDKTTATNQKKALSHLLASYIGEQRLPLLIVDAQIAVKNRKLFGARGAGILGFSVYGYDVTYALDENMDVDVPAVNAFIEKHAGGPMLAFGFTYIVWQFYMRLRELDLNCNFQKKMTLFHSGGWKKLQSLSVDDAAFSAALKENLNLAGVHNYYGMAEQLGSVYVACEQGRLHASNYSQIVVRSAQDFSPLPIGQTGLIETMSVLPWSYPGHALLTEDEGVLLGEDDCPCGRKGKYFKIIGRIQNAELRGCSDIYANKL